MGRHQTFSEKFWQDKHGHFVVWQRPNLFLITWFVCVMLSILLPNGFLQSIIQIIAEVSIVIWSFLEFFWGVNYFRRLLGFCVLLLIFVARFI